MVERKPGILMRDRHWIGLTIACLLGGLVLRLDGAALRQRYVVFNHRGGHFRKWPRCLTDAEPLLRFPAQGRDSANYLSASGKAWTGAKSFDDIKVYSARDLLEQNMWLVAASRERILLRSEGMWSAEP